MRILGARKTRMRRTLVAAAAAETAAETAAAAAPVVVMLAHAPAAETAQLAASGATAPWR
jgi:hypothetical protein